MIGQILLRDKQKIKMNCFIHRDTKIENLTQTALLRSLVFTNPDWEDQVVVFDNAYIPGKLRDNFLTDRSAFVQFPCCDALLWSLAMSSDIDSDIKEKICSFVLCKNYSEPQVVSNNRFSPRFISDSSQAGSKPVGSTFFISNLVVNMLKTGEEDELDPSSQTFELRARAINRPSSLRDVKKTDISSLVPHFYKLLRTVPKIVIEEVADLKTFGFDLTDLSEQYKTTPAFKTEDGVYVLRGEEYSLFMRLEQYTIANSSESEEKLVLSLVDESMMELITTEMKGVDEIDRSIFDYDISFECLSIRTIDRLCSLYSYMHKNL